MRHALCGLCLVGMTTALFGASSPQGRWVRAAHVRSEAPFRAVGVFWREPVTGPVRVRASIDGQNWGGWVTPMAETLDDGRTTTGLLYFGPEHRSLEIEGLRDPETLLIDPGDSAFAPAVARPAEVQAPEGPPAMVTREQWGCTPQTCPVKDPPVYTAVSHLIVHHTAGTNAAADWAAVVRSIWVLHVQGNGWNDIGYNFLIDPNGFMYEGRAGGDGVLGAHFSGVNSGTVGVALLGTFIDQMPPAPMRDMLSRMLAWQALRWHLDPAGQSLHTASGLILNVISGHRDAGISPKATSTTECPGNTAYTLLPGLREEVTAKVAPCVLLTGERSHCVPAEGGDVVVGMSAPQSGCSPTIAAPAVLDWIAADPSDGGVRLRVVANQGARRSAVVSISGQNVTITQASAAERNLPCISQRGAVNAADFDARPVAPGSLVTLFGENFAEGATSVTLNGRPVATLFSGKKQINFLLPATTATGTNYLAASAAGVTGPSVGLWVTEAMPAVFTDTERHVIAVNFDEGTLNSPMYPVRPGRPFIVYVTGAGATDSSVLHHVRYSWKATIGGAPAGALFLGAAPGFPGVYQANLTAPSTLAPGDHPLIVTVNGVASREAAISIGQGPLTPANPLR